MMMNARLKHLFANLRLVITAGVIGLCSISMAKSEEIEAGTVINIKNLDDLSKKTFEGKKLNDLLTDKQRTWIKKYGLNITLRHSKPMIIDSRYSQATQKYATQVKFNATTKKVENYVAGVPFPNIDLNDPDAGYKLIWNNYYANPVIGDLWVAQGKQGNSRLMYLTTAKDGLIKSQGGGNYKLLMEGRISGGPHRLGNGNIHKLALLGYTYPYDVAGTGLFQIQYNTGQPDEVWMYVKAIRRIRRVSGEGAWMDPQPGLDLLNDDNQGIDAYPLWYQSFQLKGKRSLLVIVHEKNPSMDNRPIEERFDVKHAPYWNPINTEWEPREVFVIEATPPKKHPYSRKTIYMDAQFPTNYMTELYDRKGEFWKIWQQGYCQCKTADGYDSIGYVYTLAIDFQNERATIISPVGGEILVNVPGITDRDFRPELLIRMGSGQLPFDTSNIKIGQR